ncbi:hypothetical protein [Streptomyces sp. DH41]|uniref:hypothetical protein n=1 Tax=Streptomyces sp. DH41 TaxID=3040125 RepID=UPI0024426F10|nr:hypothetical protein [Streptomyces sp. DH41]MDG9722861.1 hypothetical protein [Streptomyces sp. DH41]
MTTTDDKVSRWLGVRAPLTSSCLRTLAELNDGGNLIYVLVGPLLPHFATQPEFLDHLLEQLVDVGITDVFMEHINLKRVHPRSHGPGFRLRARRRPRGVFSGADDGAPRTA